MDKKFRNLPSVDRLLSEERIRQLQQNYPHTLIVDFIRRYLQQVRLSIATSDPCPSINEIAESIYIQARTLASPALRPVINATGVILHTNLGRAPLSQEAIAAMEAMAKGYCNLELDSDSRKRGPRNTHLEPVLCQLTGAEAALVVNNNASAVLLALTALAKKKDVIVSRGQAVEIGDGFRIPDIMRQSGAKLIEVGTTNCTYTTDYEQAINPRTAALMRVHSSNFRLTGFTHFVTLNELVTLSKHYELPVFDNLGSGSFLDTTRFGLNPEPMVPQSVAIGAGLVLFSGDKLTGGPQAGIIVGRKQLIDKLKKHPLARTVRIDKIRLAGLAATLIHYLKDEAVNKIPVWRMISSPLEEIDRRARLWAQPFQGLARVVDGETMIGGGSLPGGTLPTRLVTVGEAEKRKRQNIAQPLSQRLYRQEIPVIGRISDNVLLLDPRSVLPEEDDVVLQAIQRAITDLKHT
jgi:L-seryl-tRNA(Ser) seleniumtransferase